MAQQDVEGGYSNPAMDGVGAEAETALTAEELCLRVDKLEVTDSPTKVKTVDIVA